MVEILLRKFPELINVLTVEKWSPLHAACINGHTSIFEYLLKFPFRKELLAKRKDKSGYWEYEVAFDVNQCDVTGQTLLYLACCVSNAKIVDLLLGFKLKAKKVSSKVAKSKEGRKAKSKDDQGEEPLTSQLKRKNVSGIQALISKLRGNNDDLLGEDESWLNPLQARLQCLNPRQQHEISLSFSYWGSKPW